MNFGSQDKKKELLKPAVWHLSIGMILIAPGDLAEIRD